MKARLSAILMGSISLSIAGRTIAGPFSTQPEIGVVADYASNPALATVDGRSEEHEALLVNLPLDYDLDRTHFALTPRVRYSDASGYSSVTSNYYHVDAKAAYIDDFDTFGVSGSFYRDSSLLYAGEVVNGIGVRRDTSSIDANWLRVLTERFELQLDANTQRTLYELESNADTNLVDYRNSSVTPALIYVLDERTTVKVFGSVGRYYSLNHLTSSETKSLQLEYDRKLTELWSLSASAGYSKSLNAFDYYLFGFFYLGTITSRQNGTVYSASLTRQGERLSWTGTVSRLLTPTGFAFLSRQDNATLTGTYTPSDRWSVDLNATYSDNTNPLITGGTLERHFYDVFVSAHWRWTENWTVSMHLGRISQRYATSAGGPAFAPASNDVGVEISRLFNRTNQ